MMRVWRSNVSLADARCLIYTLCLVSIISAGEVHAADPGNPVPTHLKISTGTFWGTNYLVELGGNGDVHYRTTHGVGGKTESEIVLHPSVDKWREFRSSLNKLNVWSWKSEYVDQTAPTDGFSWSAEITYSDHEVVSHGYEAVPALDGSATSLRRPRDTTFADFLHAVSVLIDKPF